MQVVPRSAVNLVRAATLKSEIAMLKKGVGPEDLAHLGPTAAVAGGSRDETKHVS